MIKCAKRQECDFLLFPHFSKFVANMDAQKNVLMMIFHAIKQDIAPGKFY